MACSDFESSVIPSSQSPKVDLTWFLWRTVPLQKVSFMLLGRVLGRIELVNYRDTERRARNLIIRIGFLARNLLRI